MYKLPAISLRDHSDEELAKKIVSAFETVGFLSLENVSEIDFDMLLKCCKWFFHLPQERKNKLLKKLWNKENKNVFRGYFPIIPDNPSRKEGFEFAKDVPEDDSAIDKSNWFYEPSVWPVEDGSVPFKEFLLETYDTMTKIALQLLRLISIGLGINADALTNLFRVKPTSLFRMLHYPAWDKEPPRHARTEDGKVVITPQHTDSICITLLTTFDYKGLEILTHEGKWEEIIPKPNSLIVNIGDLLSRMTNGRLKATIHRVIDIGIDRYSVPFFLEPSCDADVGQNFMSKEKDPNRKVIKYGPWVLNLMRDEKKFFEFQNLPDIDW